MAKFRKIHTTFWDDSLIEQVSPEDKYFYLFLMTNPLCTECGIYVISLRKMAYYTGYNEDAIKVIINRFVEKKRIVYDTSTDEVCILKKPNYIDRLGTPVVDCIISELNRVKNKKLVFNQLKHITRQEVRDVYDTWATRVQEKEKEKESNKEESSAGEVPSPYPLPSSVIGYNQLPDGRSYITREIFFTAKDFGDLPTETLGAIRTLLKVIKNVDVIESDVVDLWSAFKHLKLTFQKPYRNANDVYEHFSNWCKTQSFRKGAALRTKKTPAEPLPSKATPNLQNMANRYD